MPWISWIEESDATGNLAQEYEKHAGPQGVDHVLKIHSLNAPSLEHHYRMYEHLMRGPSGLSTVEREMIAVTVSVANDCFY